MKAEKRSLEKKYDKLRTAQVRLQSGIKVLLDANEIYDGLDDQLVNGVEAEGEE